jgi:hypothetical protein
MNDVTRFLIAIERGEPKAAEQFLPSELRRLASSPWGWSKPTPGIVLFAIRGRNWHVLSLRIDQKITGAITCGAVGFDRCCISLKRVISTAALVLAIAE